MPGYTSPLRVLPSQFSSRHTLNRSFCSSWPGDRSNRNCASVSRPDSNRHPSDQGGCTQTTEPLALPHTLATFFGSVVLFNWSNPMKLNNYSFARVRLELWSLRWGRDTQTTEPPGWCRAAPFFGSLVFFNCLKLNQVLIHPYITFLAVRVSKNLYYSRCCMWQPHVSLVNKHLRRVSGAPDWSSSHLLWVWDSAHYIQVESCSYSMESDSKRKIRFSWMQPNGLLWYIFVYYTAVTFLTWDRGKTLTIALIQTNLIKCFFFEAAAANK